MLKDDDYSKYRGKCKEMVDEAIKKDSSLIAVRGYYYDPEWGRQTHWWCKRDDGSIYDPSARQFPSKGNGVYEEFDGNVECSNCGKKIKEEFAIIDGNGHYAFCSSECNMRFVGL